MRVAFAKGEDKGRRWSTWEAVRAKRTRIVSVPSGVGNDIPHDLAQFVIEASTGYANGFWGLVAKGATFKSTQRKRTKPGRAVIAAHRAELIASEQLANVHYGAWKHGDRSPTSVALDRAFAQWRALRPGERLVFQWPSTEGVVERRLETGSTVA